MLTTRYSYRQPANEYAVDGAPDGPPAFQRFRKQDAPPRFAHGAFLPYDTAPQDVLDRPRRTSSDASSVSTVGYCPERVSR